MSKGYMDDIRDQLRVFAEKRNWDQFHSPKNLVMALMSELGELAEHFQWLTEPASFNLADDKRAQVEDELADIFIYVVRLSDKLNVDLIKAARRKIAKNEIKYPANKVRGSSKKYTDY
jgi:dCTP diphosphatase